MLWLVVLFSQRKTKKLTLGSLISFSQTKTNEFGDIAIKSCCVFNNDFVF